MSPEKSRQISSTNMCMIAQYQRCVSIRLPKLYFMSDLSRRVPLGAEMTTGAKVKYTAP